MSTRTAEPGKPLKQGRYSSSPEFERGLLANLVAHRCQMLSRLEDRELIWFLQLLSHQEGGIEKVTSDLLARFPDRIATKSMRAFGMKTGQIYNAAQVRTIRLELWGAGCGADFPLKGEAEIDSLGAEALLDETESRKVREAREAWEARESNKHPNSYPASDFIRCCSEAASENVADLLKRLCLDPAEKLEDCKPWYFPELIPSLREYQVAWIESRRPKTVTTVGQIVCDALDYAPILAKEQNNLVLIDGRSRIGKTFQAKAWVDQNPGRARYVEVPSSNDDISFFRAIGKGVGISTGLGWKVVQLRERIKDVLGHCDLTLLLDQAHYLWPVTDYRYALPGRINFILDLVDKGVPVALITTPQFIMTQKVVERRTHWTSEQLIGRIGHYEKLPDSLSEKDLTKVAESLLPEGDAKSIEILVCYAQASAKYLAGIGAAVCRARFLAGRDGREKVIRADIQRAIKESVIPSDSALAAAMEEASGKRARKPVSMPLQPLGRAAAEPPALPVGRASRTDFADRNSAVHLDNHRAGLPLTEAALVPG